MILQVAGPVLTPWRDDIAALLVAWYPGQEAGDALARVLFGDTEPGGRLPVSFPKAEGDTPTAGNPLQYPGVLNQAVYSEGIFTGYRWYDQNQVEPAFPFGYGLSYTQFAFEDLQVSANGDRIDAAVTVRNTGRRAGWAVPQFYVGLPSPSADVPQPPRVLKGYGKRWLQPNTSARVAVTLESRGLSYWDIETAGWRNADGCYVIEAGNHSRDLPLRQTVIRAAGVSVPGNC